ncbi:putative cytochrome P450 [Talaromyces proteolyticus]|uniref:Cytochrome P450 n=1 Tax=Talaromyces proteolyticus TaxID=1131652 RepID=A0AAD4Q0I6_9EURO|nr:putative cytochrome P450 [Talaromyces proteolyticus]KAH8700864.1 putative cytochrome P450 [Talaromyces proteolyticus]
MAVASQLTQFSSKKKGSSKEPFGITMAGKSIYLLTNPKDVAEVYRHEDTLSRDMVVKDLYSRTGISMAKVERLLVANSESPHNKGLPRPLHYVDIAMEYFRRELSPGEPLDRFVDEAALPAILKAFDFGRTHAHSAILHNNGDSLVVSLEHLCIEALINGVIDTYYGPSLRKVNPDFVHSFMMWERVNWKYIFQLPGFLSKDMLDAKSDLVDTFVTYFEMDRAERGCGNFFVDSVEDTLREAGMGNEEVGRIFFLHSWAILGNMQKAAFWIIAHLMYDPNLLEAIRAEILPAVEGGEVNHQYLVKDCPLLDSLYADILRATMSSPMVRDVMETTTIAGKKLRKGNRIMISYRQLHLNTDVWGTTPELVQPDRFLRDKSLKTNNSYRPWGGGSTLCPGRFFAKKAIFTFVAVLLGRYPTIRIDEVTVGGKKGGSKPAFPRADFSKPIPGIVPPIMGDDIRLVLR